MSGSLSGFEAKWKDPERFQAAMKCLDALAEQYSEDESVIGFRVFGPIEPYQDLWNSEGRSPLRWRSGEWFLRSGFNGFEPIFRGQEMHDSVVKIYKDRSKGGNGGFAITTTATTPEEFLSEFAHELDLCVANFTGDLEFTFQVLLPQICQLWAKLNGYKADGVFESRILTTGEPMPAAHMDLVNRPRSGSAVTSTI